jgi:hypothetical protein
MLICLSKSHETNFRCYLTIFLIYRNQFYHFMTCELLAVIILALVITCSNCFTVHKVIIILEWFHFWCVMHLISFPEWPLWEFLDLQINYRNYIAILVIPRISKSLLNHLYSMLECFQLCCYWNVSTTCKCPDAMFWYAWCIQVLAWVWWLVPCI